MMFIHIDTAHEVMDTRSNGNRLLDRVDVYIVLTLVAKIGQFCLPYLLLDSCHIQIDLILAVIACSDIHHFGRNDIARHEVFQLRILFFHEIPRLTVPSDKEPSALAASCFGNQQTLPGDTNGGGVILDEFEVSKLHSLFKQHRLCIGGVVCGTCRHAVKKTCHTAEREDGFPL